MNPRSLFRTLVLLLLLVAAYGAQKRNSSPRRPTRAKAPKGSVSDKEYTRRRSACSISSDVLNPCTEQQVDHENCIMKCVSQSCYHKTFPEPLEEGEVAFERTNRFKRCAKEDIKTAYRRDETL